MPSSPTQLKSGRSDARIRLTVGRIGEFKPLAGQRQSFLWDAEVRQLAVRATAGKKAFVFQARLKSSNKGIRLTIGDVRDWSILQAREEARRIQALIDQGIDPRTSRSAVLEAREDELAKREVTLSVAIEEYVSNKRRSKDNLPLKPRTIADYRGMVAPAKSSATGSSTKPGVLTQLAGKSIYTISGDDIRDVHAAAMKRGERQAAYAMQVLRAVLNWYGVKVPGNPLGRDSELPGRDRIAVPQARSASKPIPVEHLANWYQALMEAANPESRDYLLFLLLTGCRVSEPKQIQIGDCDLKSSRAIIRDTKNRKDHTLLLSRQAQEIVRRRMEGRGASDHLFSVVDAKKTIATICRRSCISFSAKDLRATFASIAGGLVTAYVLKAMMNHSGSNDVTGTHYVRVSDADLRNGWQAVADYIDNCSGKELRK